MNQFASKSRVVAWMVWVIGSVFYGYQYILRVMPNIMITDIMQQFEISAGTFGQFSGVYYIGYSLIHLPIGIMLDRFGPKKVMSACILLTVIGLTPLIFAEHWAYPIIGRLLIGIGSSAAILGVFKIIRMSFSGNLFPRMLSLSVTIGLIGAIYGGGPVNYMRETFGYQTVVQLIALGGLLLAGLTFWIIPDIKQTSNTTVVSDIKEVLGNKRVIWTCIFAGLMVGPLEGFADVWGTVFLKGVYGFDGTMAASLPSLIFVGMCFGSPILSFIAERLKNFIVTIIGAGLAMTMAFALLLFLALYPNTANIMSIVITVCFMLVGMCSAYQILAIYKASTYVRENVAGLTTAVANMIIMIFGYAFHTVIGGLINFFGGPHISQALIYGIAVIPILLMLGTTGFSLLLFTERTSKTVIE